VIYLCISPLSESHHDVTVLFLSWLVTAVKVCIEWNSSDRCVWVCGCAWTGKAARDMMFLTMALEQPHILVLNYAPGPIDTEMQVTARTETGDSELRAMFQSNYYFL